MLRRLHACSRIGRQAAAIAIFGGSCLTCSYSEGRIYSSGYADSIHNIFEEISTCLW